MRYKGIREEGLKNKVAADFFEKFDCTEIIGNIDFSVKVKAKNNAIDFNQYFLWAEAKTKSNDVATMLTQLVLTIGKARTFDKILPPPFLGCFDSEKIAFVRYTNFQNIFHQNDFNWNVAPNDRETKEFKQVHAIINKIIDNSAGHEIFQFDFDKDERNLLRFIKENFVVGKNDTAKIRIDKNNFINIYDKWLKTVKPTIQLLDWKAAHKAGIIEGDFYLADLLSRENETIIEKLFVVLRHRHYVMNRHKDKLLGTDVSSSVHFSDGQKAHNQFWTIYERPPKEEYWDYIIDRRDLLVPQDVRERKGSFFTPRMWVELSQKYIADVFGEDWQDEYHVWDCAAGTGNLLFGLTNKKNIWASTLDKPDVDVMHQRIDNGANLLKDHCFQFDFLNGDFKNLPKGLRKIIEETPEKLIVYINPPYAEVSSIQGGKKGVNISKTHSQYTSILGTAGRELFTQFFIRILKEIPCAKLAAFSKLKYISGSAFESFRNHFLAEYKGGFVCPANTFDNVVGLFPIGFLIWCFEKKNIIDKLKCDVFDNNGKYMGVKKFYAYKNSNYINEWISKYSKKTDEEYLGFLAGTNGNGFQHNSIVYILNKREQMPNPRGIFVRNNNLIESCIYFTVRKCIDADWLNDRDQFLYPNDGYKSDTEFQNDCLAYTLFHSGNNISSKQGTNHWIPFTESEVKACGDFESNFMTDFIKGKLKDGKQYGFAGGSVEQIDFLNNVEQLSMFSGKRKAALKFSPEAQDVFDAGRKLWRYYHSQWNAQPNASFYDIREHFQGRNDKGKMNNKSDDEKYNALIGDLRAALKVLAKKIEPKIYEYGFLKG